MNVSEKQRKWLYNYLDKVFVYGETLTEVYDHVLTAAENYEGNPSFEKLATDIIQSDFGGLQKLRELEKNYKTLVYKELKKYMANSFLNNLRSRGIFIAIAVGIAVFYTRLNLLSTPILESLLIIYWLLFLSNFFYLRYNLRTLYDNNKKSVKEKLLYTILSYPIGLILSNLVVPLVLTHDQFILAKYLNSFSTLQVLYLILLYILLPVYILSYYEAFKREYKFSIK